MVASRWAVWRPLAWAGAPLSSGLRNAGQPHFGVARHSLQRTFSEVHPPAHCAGSAPGIYGILEVKCCTMAAWPCHSCAVHGGTTGASGKPRVQGRIMRGQSAGTESDSRQRPGTALAVASRGTSHRQSSIAHELLGKCVTPSPKAGGVKESLNVSSCKVADSTTHALYHKLLHGEGTLPHGEGMKNCAIL